MKIWPRTGTNYLVLVQAKSLFPPFVSYSIQMEKNHINVTISIFKQCFNSLKDILSTRFTFGLAFFIQKHPAIIQINTKNDYKI